MTAASTSGVQIRSEQETDVEAIDEVVRLAFAPDETVAPLVQLIRSSDRYVKNLALVAVLDDVVVGHVMLSYVELVDEADVHRSVLSLSPLSVAPSHQRVGIGTELSREALRRADEADEPLVTVQGHPTYYPRFGFGLAETLGISITLPSWAPPGAAMACKLSNYSSAYRGRLVYPPAFDDVSDEPPPPASG